MLFISGLMLIGLVVSMFVIKLVIISHIDVVKIALELIQSSFVFLVGSTQLHIFSKSGGLRLMGNLSSHSQLGPIAYSSDYNWGGLLRGLAAESVTLSMSMVGK